MSNLPNKMPTHGAFVDTSFGELAGGEEFWARMDDTGEVVKHLKLGDTEVNRIVESRFTLNCIGLDNYGLLTCKPGEWVRVAVKL